jgi:VanZ family protein
LAALTFKRIVFAAYLALVGFATLAPLSGGVLGPFADFDKLIHVGLFAGVAFLMLWAEKSGLDPRAVTVIVVTAVLAGLIEVIQGVLPFRAMDGWDFLAGVIGAVIGAVAQIAIASRLRTQSAVDTS